MPAVLGPDSRRARSRGRLARASRSADERADQVDPAGRDAGPQRARGLRHGRARGNERGVQGHRGRPGHGVLSRRPGLLRGDQRARRRARPHDHGGRARRQLRADPLREEHDPAPGEGSRVLPVELRGHPDAHAGPAGDQAVRRPAGAARRQLHRRPAAARGPLRRARVQRPRVLPAGDVGAGRALLGDRRAHLRRLLPGRRLRPQRHRRRGPGAGRARGPRGGRDDLSARRQVRGRHGPGGERAPPGRRGRRALHRRLPGLRRLRPHRPRPRLDRADLQRLVRGLRRHAPAPASSTARLPAATTRAPW